MQLKECTDRISDVVEGLHIEQEMQLKDYTDRKRDLVEGLHRQNKKCSKRITQKGQYMQWKDYTYSSRYVV